MSQAAFVKSFSDKDPFKYFSGIVVAQSTTHATTTKLKYAKNYFRKPTRCLPIDSI